MPYPFIHSFCCLTCSLTGSGWDDLPPFFVHDGMQTDKGQFFSSSLFQVLFWDLFAWVLACPTHTRDRHTQQQCGWQTVETFMRPATAPACTPLPQHPFPTNPRPSCPCLSTPFFFPHLFPHTRPFYSPITRRHCTHTHSQIFTLSPVRPHVCLCCGVW